MEFESMAGESGNGINTYAVIQWTVLKTDFDFILKQDPAEICFRNLEEWIRKIIVHPEGLEFIESTPEIVRSILYCSNIWEPPSGESFNPADPAGTFETIESTYLLDEDVYFNYLQNEHPKTLAKIKTLNKHCSNQRRRKSDTVCYLLVYLNLISQQEKEKLVRKRGYVLPTIGAEIKGLTIIPATDYFKAFPFSDGLKNRGVVLSDDKSALLRYATKFNEDKISALKKLEEVYNKTIGLTASEKAPTTPGKTGTPGAKVTPPGRLYNAAGDAPAPDAAPDTAETVEPGPVETDLALPPGFKVVERGTKKNDQGPPKPMTDATLKQFIQKVLPYIHEIGAKEAQSKRWGTVGGTPRPGRHENAVIEYNGIVYDVFYDKGAKEFNVRLCKAPNGEKGKPRYFKFYRQGKPS